LTVLLRRGALPLATRPTSPRRGRRPRHPLLELNDLLSKLSTRQLQEVVADADVEALSHVTQNYVAAIVEHACQGCGADAPAWTRRVLPLEAPFFAAPLASLRLHLLKASPVAFKRRNIFIDSTLGDRV
jgi:hypothetical protein